MIEYILSALLPRCIKVKPYTKGSNTYEMPQLTFIPEREQSLKSTQVIKCSLESIKEPMMAQQSSPNQKRNIWKNVVVNNIIISGAFRIIFDDIIRHQMESCKKITSNYPP